MITPKIDPVLVLDEKGTLKAARRASVVQEEGRLTSSLVFAHRTRHLILFLGTICLTAIVSNSLALNFTVICMYDDSAPRVENSTARPLLYTELQQSWLFSAVAMGTLLGAFPISYLTSRFGMKTIFLVYGMISTVSTLLLPLMVSIGFPMVFLMRVLQGLAVATSFPAMGAIIAEWSTLRKSGTYVAWVSTHLQLGQIFTMPVAGELCDSSWGWPSLYYLQGIISLLLFIIFYIFYTDSPTMHRNVSHKELTTIQKNKVIQVLEKGERLKIPYKAILTDKSVLGILASCFGASVGFQFFFQYGAVYLNQVQGFDVRDTGFAAALPFILSMLFKFIIGPCSDSLPYVTEKTRVIIFASLSQYAMAACFLTLAFLPASEKLLAQICFTASIVFSGMNAVGVTKSSQLISGPFVHFLMALNMLIASVVILLIPFLVAVFAPNGLPSEWAKLFIGTGILVIIVTTIFNFTAEVEHRPWVRAAQSSHKVQPEADVQPQVFQFDAKDLQNVERVEQILQAKRLSVQSGSASLNFPSRQAPAQSAKRQSIYSVD